jgi:hypothetical protein
MSEETLKSFDSYNEIQLLKKKLGNVSNQKHGKELERTE